MRHSSPILGTIALALCAFQSSQAQSADSASQHNGSAAQHITVRQAGVPSTSPSHAPRADAASSSDSARVSPTDVERRALEVFGSDSAISAPAAARTDSAAEPTWDMDVRQYETQDRVAHYVNIFSGRAKQRITERLERGTRYEPMIRAKLRAGGLPEDMYYLAFIESGFDPHAYSKAAAVGMWQFMSSTGRDLGLRIDWWVDERRDPVKSTGAAVRFIKGLRDQFGSLYLAAAAYNGGPGRVARGLARYADDLENTQGEDAFFVLAEKDYLRNETREYVPQLIAAALIAKDPTRYGMELHSLAPLAYDSVQVPASTPLAAVAKAANVSTSEIRDLNPHFLRGMTPPRVLSIVRVPQGAGASFDSAFAALPHESLVATHVVESKKGDTADRVAERSGVSTSALEAFNPGMRRLKSGRLAPGQSLLIPTAAVAAAALNVPDPSIERFPNSTKKVKLHTVKRGESVGGIAKKYGTSSARIMRLNGLKKPMIFPGQSLIVSGSLSEKRSKSHASAKHHDANEGSASVEHSSSKKSSKSGTKKSAKHGSGSATSKASKSSSAKSKKGSSSGKMSSSAKKSGKSSASHKSTK